MLKWAVAILFSLPAFGQAAFYQFPVPLPGATFRVCPVGVPNPCPSPASIFSDQALTLPISQPAQTGPTGQYGFWVGTGQYTIQIGQPYNFVYVVNLGGGGGGGSVSFSPLIKASAQLGATSDVQISNAIAALTGGGGIVWADYSANQTWAACPTWGSGNVQVVLYPVSYTYSGTASTCSIPGNVTLQVMQGATLNPATGKTINILGNVLAGRQKIFTNATAGLGTIDFTGSSLIEKVYPEWWGVIGNNSTGGVMTTNTAALQAALIGAFGSNRTNGSGLSNYNRLLWFSDIYFINGTINCYHLNGFRIEGANKLLTGISQTAANSPIFNCQSVTYGDMGNFRVSTSASQNDALIKLDYNTSQGTDLAVENITLHDMSIFGNGLGQIGVIVAPSGGGSQGDNVRFINNFASGFTQSCYQIGGNNTGLNAGRFYATNAIQIQFVGGDVQACAQYGIASYGGSYSVIGTTFENNTNGNATQTGVDMYCEGAQGFDRCKMDRVRSESLRLAAGGPWTITDSFITAGWCSTFDNVAGNSEPINQLISGTWVGGDGKCYQVTVSGTFGGLPLTTPTSATATTLVNSGASYTTNAFVGNKASIMQGTDSGCYGIVTANNATTITFGAGLVTDYDATSGISCTATPDATSKFVVEPNWGTQTTSGTATFALFDFNCLDGGFNNGTTGPPSGSVIGASFVLNNVACYNGRINATGNFNGVTVTRTDWAPAISTLLDNTVISTVFDGVLVTRVGRPSQSYNVPWTFTRNGITSAKKYSQMMIGTKPVCWAAGQTGGGVSTEDICILPDPNGAGSKNGRLQIVNNSSGTAQTTNFNADGSTTIPSVTFSTLPSSPNGSYIFCSDCNATCSAGSSTGRTCFRENGAWTH